METDVSNGHGLGRAKQFSHVVHAGLARRQVVRELRLAHLAFEHGRACSVASGLCLELHPIRERKLTLREWRSEQPGVAHGVHDNAGIGKVEV